MLRGWPPSMTLVRIGPRFFDTSVLSEALAPVLGPLRTQRGPLSFAFRHGLPHLCGGPIT
ncbi:protein of unknown function [Candidatus Hydrogenisulfobacillus filiaventi]|uniref:Uncharacterized protein n=1 Tax=Candidatus Hydrogenisulfobacillus filiaventi TaxID=2707344 RepID=A0A6F8ZF60_9FIRM|nr:protein of unknown function [Candidatus Hydrogenisulfobacillus filiaventi]